MGVTETEFRTAVAGEETPALPVVPKFSLEAAFNWLADFLLQATTPPEINMLIVDDEGKNQRELFIKKLGQKLNKVKHMEATVTPWIVDNIDGALDAFHDAPRPFDIVLIYQKPGDPDLKALRLANTIHSENTKTPVIVVSKDLSLGQVVARDAERLNARHQSFFVGRDAINILADIVVMLVHQRVAHEKKAAGATPLLTL